MAANAIELVGLRKRFGTTDAVDGVNLAVPPGAFLARTPREARRARVDEVLALLAIGELDDRYPGELSGGQQQRVAIARSIAPQPKILLFDEPLSNLDARLRVEMRTELLRVHRATGATSVYVTHDQVEAMTMATHVAVLRDGRVEQFAAPGVLLDEPAAPFVAGFIGTPPANLVPAVVRGGRYRSHSLNLAAADAPEGAVATLLYRPPRLSLVDGPGPLRIGGEYARPRRSPGGSSSRCGPAASGSTSSPTGSPPSRSATASTWSSRPSPTPSTPTATTRR